VSRLRCHPAHREGTLARIELPPEALARRFPASCPFETAPSPRRVERRRLLTIRRRLDVDADDRPVGRVDHAPELIASPASPEWRQAGARSSRRSRSSSKRSACLSASIQAGATPAFLSIRWARPIRRRGVVVDRQPLALVREIGERPSSIASRICRSTSVSRTFWRTVRRGRGARDLAASHDRA
jgi:hypothetical protein